MADVVCDLAVSLDGFVAGPGQDLEHPLGEGGELVHRWQFEAAEENATELAAIVDAGAYVMGRNMFGPIRGPWESADPWDGWWGDEPPYHGPVFVLTHHPRPDLVMAGGTTFHFVTDGPQAALDRARAAAGDRHVSICGGASTVRQLIDSIDELRLHVAPVLLGAGERLFDGVAAVDLVPVAARATELVLHTTYRRRA
ncbi:dihydrofolate reductase family protein [Cellulomonas denverensis]|uniref:Dihydrofolate reductase n=1 Tax=Cellulomonas denverensis TaxID=264297 RepID=A0A7X6QZ35_9CELL|nr:dihydrofolate reductase family protein [Cellulomonas denverensis]NKY22778.1 dihydrofolate reductase [Cellulomonas denverensis]GIG26242.1 deaminase reductase [Cellulomonas denverensis]